jgi:hypothetical protein
MQHVQRATGNYAPGVRDGLRIAVHHRLLDVCGAGRNSNFV